jgi:hypothetical protein
MRPIWILGAGLVLAGGALVAALNGQTATSAGIEIARTSEGSLQWKEPQTSAGLCPWRAPDADLRRYFPGSASTRDETLILSRQRLELQRRLGRMPGADDNALIVHRVLGPSATAGFVVTRRVRGECGLIELVLATDSAGRVLGARIQRHREPEATARVLQSEAWLGAFRGRDSRSAWTLGRDIPAVPSEAAASAGSVLAEARNVLILLDVAVHSDSSLPPRIDPVHSDRGGATRASARAS